MGSFLILRLLVFFFCLFGRERKRNIVVDWCLGKMLTTHQQKIDWLLFFTFTKSSISSLVKLLEIWSVCVCVRARPPLQSCWILVGFVFFLFISLFVRETETGLVACIFWFRYIIKLIEIITIWYIQRNKMFNLVFDEASHKLFSVIVWITNNHIMDGDSPLQDMRWIQILILKCYADVFV